MSDASKIRGDDEPDPKRRRRLDAGGPVEDDGTARQKMKDASVGDEAAEDGQNGVITGFDPDNVTEVKHLHALRGDVFRIAPMGYFATMGDLPMMRWLYVNGADTRDKDVGKNFPLYAAAFRGYYEMCKWLHAHGAASDIKRRTRVAAVDYQHCDDLHPLWAALSFESARYRVSKICSPVGRWLILNGCLCKDDNSGKIDVEVLRKVFDWDKDEPLDKDSDATFFIQRKNLLQWAEDLLDHRSSFLVFLMGTHSPDYSPSALRQVLAKRLSSDDAANLLLGTLPLDKYRQLWDDIHEKRNRCPLTVFSGKSGILERIADYAGILRGREACIIRQLTETLPPLDRELDQKRAERMRAGSNDDDDDDDSRFSTSTHAFDDSGEEGDN